MAKVGKSKGLGDTVKRITDITGISKVVEKVSEVLTGDPNGCGCAGRQEFLNQMFPYKTEQDENYVEIDGERIRLMN